MTLNKYFIPLRIMNGSECDLGTCQREKHIVHALQTVLTRLFN